MTATPAPLPDCANADWPPFDFPPAEAEMLRASYAAADVIMEYGSGGSTVYAASLRGKRVFSVETDRDWTLRMQSRIDRDGVALATVVHADIGPTGKWGRPTDPAAWPRFLSYVLGIWDAPYMRHPDVVLIDGRFRAACMLAALARIQRPIRILFDDYADRKPYHVVEEYARPVKLAGRMAVFDVVPELIPAGDLAPVFTALGQVTYADQPAHYDMDADEAIARRIKDMDGKR